MIIMLVHYHVHVYETHISSEPSKFLFILSPKPMLDHSGTKNMRGKITLEQEHARLYVTYTLATSQMFPINKKSQHEQCLST